jgi:hypothetical protein
MAMVAVALAVNTSPAWAKECIAARQKISTVRIPFVPNVGQVPPEVAFYAQTLSGRISVMGNGQWVYSLPVLGVPTKHEAAETGAFLDSERVNCPRIAGWGVLRERLLGSQDAAPRGMDEAVSRVNILLGNDPDQWRQGLHTFSRVSLGEVYPGIVLDLLAHGDNVEKVFTISPGADPHQMMLEIDGANSLRLSSSGELVVETEAGPVSFSAPLAYQELEGRKIRVEVAYRVEGSRYNFNLGPYDRAYPLVIDPLLASTFLGGISNEYIYALATAPNGDVLVAGHTSSANHPVTAMGYDETFNGGFQDIVISRLDSRLETLMASTFLGGSDDDRSLALAVAANGDVLVAGYSSSGNYPVTAGAYDRTKNRYGDIVISRLSGDLSILRASTYLGGSDSDLGKSVKEAANGDVLVAGYTFSTNYPVTAGAYSETNKGPPEFVISRLDSNLATLVASTYLGGSGEEYCADVLEAANGDVLLGGWSNSTNFPVTEGAYGPSYGGGDYDIVIARLGSHLTTLVASTYLGGSNEDWCAALAEATNNDLLVVGYSASSNFPVSDGAYDTRYDGFSFGMDIVVSRLSSNLAAISASTYLGGGSEDFGNDIAEAANGDVVVVGTSGSTDFPTPVGAFNRLHNGGVSDIVVSRLDATLQALVASTYLGGSNGDYCRALSMASNGDVLVAGWSVSTNFPVTEGAYGESFGGGTQDSIICRLDWTLGALGVRITGIQITNSVDVEVTWTATNNAFYSLQKSMTVADSQAWTDVSGATNVTGPLDPPWSLTQTNYSGGALTALFYRVRAWP